MSVVFPTRDIGGLTEIKPSDDAVYDRPTNRRPQLFIGIGTLPLRTIYYLLYSRQEFRSEVLGSNVLSMLGRLFMKVLSIVWRRPLIGT